MDTRKKLQEAEHFLKILSSLEDLDHDSDKFYFNFSAFLTAWRSTLDVMLYDFAERFGLGFTRDDEMTEKEFRAVSKALDKREALDFIKWWVQKQQILSSNPLWSKRNLNIHRGRAPLTKHEYFVYVAGSGGTSGTVSLTSSSVTVYTTSALTSYTVGTDFSSPQSSSTFWSTTGEVRKTSEWEFSDFPDQSAMDICRKAFDEMRKIVEDAETRFKTEL